MGPIEEVPFSQCASARAYSSASGGVPQCGVVLGLHRLENPAPQNVFMSPNEHLTDPTSIRQSPYPKLEILWTCTQRVHEASRPNEPFIDPTSNRQYPFPKLENIWVCRGVAPSSAGCQVEDAQASSSSLVSASQDLKQFSTPLCKLSDSWPP